MGDFGKGFQDNGWRSEEALPVKGPWQWE